MRVGTVLLLAWIGCWALPGCEEGIAVTPENCLSVFKQGDPQRRLDALRVAMSAQEFKSRFDPQEYENMKKALEYGYQRGMSPEIWVNIVDLSTTTDTIVSLVRVRAGDELNNAIIKPLAGQATTKGTLSFTGSNINVFPSAVAASIEQLDDEQKRQYAVSAIRKLRLLIGAPATLKAMSFTDLAAFTKQFGGEGFAAIPSLWPKLSTTERVQVFKCVGLYLKQGDGDLGTVASLVVEVIGGARDRVHAIHRQYGGDGLARRRRALLDNDLVMVRTALDLVALAKTRDPDLVAAIQALADDVVEVSLEFTFPLEAQDPAGAGKSVPFAQVHPGYEEQVKALIDQPVVDKHKDPDFMGTSFKRLLFHSFSFSRLMARSEFNALPEKYQALFQQEDYVITPRDRRDDILSNQLPEEQKFVTGLRSVLPIDYVEIEAGEGADVRSNVNAGLIQLIEETISKAEPYLDDAVRQKEQMLRDMPSEARGELQKQLADVEAARERFQVIKEYIESLRTQLPRFITSGHLGSLDAPVRGDLRVYPPLLTQELETQCAVTLALIGADDAASRAIIDRVNARLPAPEPSVAPDGN